MKSEGTPKSIESKCQLIGELEVKSVRISAPNVYSNPTYSYCDISVWSKVVAQPTELTSIGLC